MRVVCVSMLAGFTVGTVVSYIETSSFLCGKGVEVGVLEGFRDHLQVVHASCSTSEWVVLVLREVDQGVRQFWSGLIFFELGFGNGKIGFIQLSCGVASLVVGQVKFVQFVYGLSIRVFDPIPWVEDVESLQEFRGRGIERDEEDILQGGQVEGTELVDCGFGGECQ